MPKNHSIRETLGYGFAPDPRQRSAFTAGWMLGCLAALAAEGASHLDFFETEGARGFVIDNKITPAFALLDRILQQNPTYLFFSQSNNPLAFSSLGIYGNNGHCLYVANHTDGRLPLLVDDS